MSGVAGVTARRAGDLAILRLAARRRAAGAVRTATAGPPVRVQVDRSLVEAIGRGVRSVGAVGVRTMTASAEKEPDGPDGPDRASRPVAGGVRLLRPGRASVGGNPGQVTAARSGFDASAGRGPDRGRSLSR